MASQNDYDWLGHGIYFWESNPDRALSFAKEVQGRSSGVHQASVVGAVIDLGLCLDLATEAGIQQVRVSYEIFAEIYETAGRKMPVNDGGSDLLRRPLDCAVIEALHTIRSRIGQPPIDTVKGIFVEGEPAYPGAGIRETHCQICVRNPAQIKGVFRIPNLT